MPKTDAKTEQWVASCKLKGPVDDRAAQVAVRFEIRSVSGRRAEKEAYFSEKEFIRLAARTSCLMNDDMRNASLYRSLAEYLAAAYLHEKAYLSFPVRDGEYSFIRRVERACERAPVECIWAGSIRILEIEKIGTIEFSD